MMGGQNGGQPGMMGGQNGGQPGHDARTAWGAA
jgi:hypothetical protein